MRSRLRGAARPLGLRLRVLAPARRRPRGRPPALPTAQLAGQRTDLPLLLLLPLPAARQALHQPSRVCQGRWQGRRRWLQAPRLSWRRLRPGRWAPRLRRPHPGRAACRNPTPCWRERLPASARRAPAVGLAPAVPQRLPQSPAACRVGCTTLSRLGRLGTSQVSQGSTSVPVCVPVVWRCICTSPAATAGRAACADPCCPPQLYGADSSRSSIAQKLRGVLSPGAQPSSPREV